MNGKSFVNELTINQVYKIPLRKSNIIFTEVKSHFFMLFHFIKVILPSEIELGMKSYLGSHGLNHPLIKLNMGVWLYP